MGGPRPPAPIELRPMRRDARGGPAPRPAHVLRGHREPRCQRRAAARLPGCRRLAGVDGGRVPVRPRRARWQPRPGGEAVPVRGIRRHPADRCGSPAGRPAWRQRARADLHRGPLPHPARPGRRPSTGRRRPRPGADPARENGPPCHATASCSSSPRSWDPDQPFFRGGWRALRTERYKYALAQDVGGVRPWLLLTYSRIPASAPT